MSAPETAQEPNVYDERDRLVLITPCYGHQCSTQFRDAVSLALQYPTARFRCSDGVVRSLPVLAIALNKPGDSHIDRARNTALYEFEQTPYKFGLWMDGDQPFEPNHIARIWSHLMTGKRVVGGLVALKSIVPTFVCNATHGQVPDAQGIIQPDDIGTGCLGFSRDVIEEMKEKWPAYVRARLAVCLGFADDGGTTSGILYALMHELAEMGYSADLAYKAGPNSASPGSTQHAIFASGVTWRDGGPDWLSEDWMFCHRCKLLGIPIYADTSVNIKHIGPMTFPPPPAEIIEAALKVTSGKNPPFSKKLAAEAKEALARLHADINDQSITIIHPTRGRPQEALAKKALWEQRASDKRYEYIFAVDDDDSASLNAFTDHRVITIRKGGRGTVKAVNEACLFATGRILVMAADDCIPPQDWDKLIRDAFAGQMHEPRLLWTSDSYSDQPVITHPVMTRALYEEQGYFFCPEYPHLFCDTELTVRAAAANQIIDARHIVLKHEHPMFTGQEADALHIERNSSAARWIGNEIFKKRNPGVKHPHVT